MKRKFSPPLAADRRQRKKSGAARSSTSPRRRRAAGSDMTARCLAELPLLLAAGKPVPHLLVTEVFYASPSHNPYTPCAFNRRGAIVSVPLDGGAAGTAARRLPSAAIRSRGRLADLFRRCLTFIGTTPRGHLAFAGSRGVFLVNPITDALQGVDTVGYCQKAVLATSGGNGCAVFVSLGALLSPPTLWRLDEQDGERWSPQCTVVATAEQTGDILSAVSCGNGCFYLLHEDGCMSMVNAGEPPPLRMEKLPVASLADHLSPPCETRAGGGHLLEADGDVLFVRKVLAVREVVKPFCDHTEFADIVGFEVYKLDANCWTKLGRLAGDNAIFFSPESAFAVRAWETAGCTANCVYFVGEKRCCFACGRYGGCTWGVYSLEERKVLHEHAVAGHRGGRTEALWFLPSVV